MALTRFQKEAKERLAKKHLDPEELRFIVELTPDSLPKKGLVDDAKRALERLEENERGSVFHPEIERCLLAIRELSENFALPAVADAKKDPGRPMEWLPRWIVRWIEALAEKNPQLKRWDDDDAIAALLAYFGVKQGKHADVKKAVGRVRASIRREVPIQPPLHQGNDANLICLQCARSLDFCMCPPDKRRIFDKNARRSRRR